MKRVSLVTLRKYVRADREAFLALLIDPDVMRYIGDGQPLSEEKARDEFDRILTRNGSDSLPWAIDEDGEFAGHAEIFRRDGREEFELVYILERERWHRTLGGQVVDLLLCEARQRSLPFVIATVDDRNAASLAIFRRRGFVRDETLSDSLRMNTLRFDLTPRNKPQS